MCDYYVEMMCAGRFGLSWAHDVFTVAYHMLRHTYLYLFIFLYWSVWCFSACPLLSLFLLLVALWHLNENPLLLGTLFVPGQLLFLPPLILLHLTSSFVMIKPIKTFRRNSHNEAFIRNAKLFYQTFSILIFPLSSTVGVGSHYVASQSLVSLWSYKSSTPICTDSIIQCVILSLAFEVRAS